MTDFGYNTIGATNDNPADNWIWCKATATPSSSGTLTAISVYCQEKNPLSAGSSKFSTALYTDSAGAPGSLIAGNDTTSVATSSSFQWLTHSGHSIAISSGVQYWFAIRCPDINLGNNDINVKFDTNGSATEGYFKSGGAGAFPATVSGATSFANERWSIYGTYTPSGGGNPIFLFEERAKNDPWKIGKIWAAIR